MTLYFVVFTSVYVNVRGGSHSHNSFAGSTYLSAPQQVVTPNVNIARTIEGSGESDTLMANVTVALPTYNPDVHSWFQQVETIFLMLRIKSQRIKVANLMQKLPPDVISRITDALAELPEKNPTTTLRT